MFSVGEKVIHCVHGAGVITAKKEMLFTDAPICYFVIQMFGSRSTLMVPTDRAEQRLRPVAKRTALRRLLTGDLAGQPDELPQDHKERAKQLEDKLKSGGTREWLEIVRDLTYREERGSLSSSDQQLLERTLDLLSGEIALVQDIAQAEAKARLVSIVQHRDEPDEQQVESSSWWQTLGKKVAKSFT
jgi:RNA polymerase-interacting CarD/CdnL/TRCF family regulator